MALKYRNPTGKKIDGRTPNARAVRLSGAHMDMDGRPIAGKRTTTGEAFEAPNEYRSIYLKNENPVKIPPIGTLSGESGAGRFRKSATPDLRPPEPVAAPQFSKLRIKPKMGDQLGKMDFSGAAASTAAMRSAQTERDRATLAGVHSAARLAKFGRGPATVTDPTRPADQRPSGFPRIQRTPAATPGYETATVAGKYGSGKATNGPAIKPGATDFFNIMPEIKPVDAATADPYRSKAGPGSGPAAPVRPADPLAKMAADASAAGVAAVERPQMGAAPELSEMRKRKKPTI